MHLPYDNFNFFSGGANKLINFEINESKFLETELKTNLQKTKMKKRNPFLALLFLTSIAFSQTSNKADKAQIEKLVIDSFDEIWSKLDPKNIKKYYTKDFLLLENGEVWNNDTIALYLNKAVLRKPNPKRINTIKIIDIKITKKTAWVAYHNYATFIADDKTVRKAHWLESATAVLTNEGWKFDMLHSTRIDNE